MTKKKEDKSKEEVCEVYEIENTKNHKEKIVKSCGLEKVDKGSKEDNTKYNKILIYFGGILGFLVLGLVIWIVASYIEHNFEYEEIPFNKIQEGDITVYRTYLPLTNEKGENVGKHNIYLRTDPRVLSEIPFEGEIVFIDKMYINSTKELFCKGYGTISIENLAGLYRKLGVEVKSGQNISCGNGKDYVYVNIQPGEKTEVKQIKPACYDILVKDCEILEGTEKFLIESIVQYGVKY